MKKILLFCTIALGLWACQQSDNEISPPVTGGEIKTNITEVTVFNNGDRVVVDDYMMLESICRTLTASADPVVSEIRDLYFDFKVLPSMFSFVVNMELPTGEGWKLCTFQNNAWIECENCVYQNNRVSASLTLALSNIVASKASPMIFAARFALLKTNAFVQGLEVIKDPYKANPFGALVKFNSDEKIIPTTTLIGQDDNNIITTGKEDKEHEIDVLGLYNQWDNIVHLDCKNSRNTVLRRELKIRVDYPFFNSMRVNTSYSQDFKNTAAELYFVTGGGFNAYGGNVTPWPGGSQLLEEKAPLAFDQYGKIRWTYTRRLNDSGVFYPILYKGKRCLVYYTAGTWGASIDDFDPYIEIIEMSGKQMAYFPNLRSKGIRRVHHDAIMINDHTLAMPETKNQADECQIIEFNLHTGTVTHRIDLDDIIDPNRPDILGNQNYGEDRVHINSIVYNSKDDCYVISARHQGVIKIRRTALDKSGLVWWITPPYNIDDEYKSSLLAPTNFDGSVYENWNLGQHTASILPNGDIMMFDNHNEPLFDSNLDKRISRVLVMRVDETAKTVAKIWEWHTPGNAFSGYQSSAALLPNGNMLCGWAVQKGVYETSYPDGKILFKGDFYPSNFRGDIYRYYKLSL